MEKSYEGAPVIVFKLYDKDLIKVKPHTVVFVLQLFDKKTEK